MSQPLIHISRRQALFFAGFLVLYQFLTYIANDMIMPGMIHVISSFHGPESAVATSLTAYVLGGASLQLFLGPISDRVGRRPIMLAGSLLFFIFTLAIACSHSMTQFLLARYFEGMGLCFIGVIGYATLQEIFGEMDAVRLIAVLDNISSIAPLLGPLAGATFILYFNWRGIFILIGGLALIAFAGLWRYMPEPVGALKKDGQRIPRMALTPKIVITNYKQLITNSSFMWGTIAASLLHIPCIAWIAISPVIIITDAGQSVISYALWQLPIFGACMIGNWYLCRLTHRYSLKRIIMIGSMIMSIGLLSSWVLPAFIATRFEYLMPGLIIYGFGLGITAGPLNRYVLFSTPITKGTAYAMMSMISMAIQALGVEMGNHVYTNHNNISFGGYFAWSGVVYLTVLALTFFFLQRKSAEPSSKDALSA